MALLPKAICRVLEERDYRLADREPPRKNPTKKMAGYVSPNGIEYIHVHMENETGKSALRIHPRHIESRTKLLEIRGVESERLYTASSNMWHFPLVRESEADEPCGIPFTLESEAALIAFLEVLETLADRQDVG